MVIAANLAALPASDAADPKLAQLCAALRRLGADAMARLREIPDTPRLLAADRALLAARPLPPAWQPSGFDIRMQQALAQLQDHLLHAGTMDALATAYRDAAAHGAANATKTGKAPDVGL